MGGAVSHGRHGDAFGVAEPGTAFGGNGRMRKPVVLKNVRIVDPSRTLDEVGTILFGSMTG